MTPYELRMLCRKFEKTLCLLRLGPIKHKDWPNMMETYFIMELVKDNPNAELKIKR